MDDEWGLSMEELDSLERRAVRELAERHNLSQPSSSSASLSHHATSSSPSKSRRLLPNTILSSPTKNPAKQISLKFFKDRPGRIALETQYHPNLVTALKSVPGHEWDQHRRVWTYPEGYLDHVLAAISPLSDIISGIDAVPPLFLPNARLEGSPNAKRGQQINVQIYLMNSDLIAARNPYHGNIKEACQSVSGRSWNMEERVWTFPRSSLEELVQALSNIKSPRITIEACPPLKLPGSAVAYIESQVNAVSPSVPLPKPRNRLQDHEATSQRHLSQDSSEQKSKETFSVKLMLHNSGCIAARSEYHAILVSALRSIPGAEWSAKERIWLFPLSSLQQAEKILSMNDNIIVHVEQMEPLVRRAIESSLATSDLRGMYQKMPVSLESQLLPFQRDGVRFALEHGGRVLIADEMGLGKTLQAIAFAACFETDWPVLVICPSSLRLHWATMISQWLQIHPVDIVVLMSKWAGSNREGFKIVQPVGKLPMQLDGLFNIISYDLVQKVQNEIAETGFKIIIADEAHYLKNAHAKRTVACVPLLQKAKYAILLSGTPALSRPIELFKQLQALQPGVYKNEHEYGKRYCMGGIFGVYQGASNCEELHALVKSTLMIRRLKRDVASELPLKRRQQIFLSLDDKGLRQMRALFNELDTVKRSITKSSSLEEAEKLKYSEKQLINKIYTESAEVKVSAAQDYLSTVIEADCKFLIFAYHQIMLDGIEEFLVKKKVSIIRIDGSTPASSRQALVAQFQEKENVKAAVLSIRAAGLGLTMTAASTVIFAEMSWTPGELVQAEDRAHRIGQNSSVNVYYLHAHDTIDDLIWEAVQHKLENVGQVLDGKEASLQLSAAGRHHHPIQQGQSKITTFLHACENSSLCLSQQSSDQSPVRPGKRQHEMQPDTNAMMSKDAGPHFQTEKRARGHIMR